MRENKKETSILDSFVALSAQQINNKVKVPANLHFEVIEYESSIDGTKPLYANLLYLEPANEPRPVAFYFHGYSSNRSREMYEQVRACERGFIVLSPDMRGRGTACPKKYYKDWPPTPYPLLLLQAEVDIFFEDAEIPKELLKSFGHQTIRDAISEKATSIFNQRVESGEVMPLPDTKNVSAGNPDDGAVELHDVYDCLCACMDKLPGLIDVNDIHGFGLSGGGGTVFSLVTKFPEMFSTAASFYGISDYAHWYHFSNLSSRPIFQEMMRNNIGGAPDEFYNHYQARNSLLGAANNSHTQTHLYWDEFEVQCPAYLNIQYHREATKAGLTNVHLHESTTSDAGRALHVYPFGKANRVCLERYLDDAMKHGSVIPDDHLPRDFTVLGYLRTRNFLLFLNDGRDAVAKLEVKQKEGDLIHVCATLECGPDETQASLQLFGKLFGHQVVDNMTGKLLSPVEDEQGYSLNLPFDITLQPTNATSPKTGE